ncbi:hypothetical protein C0995_013167 [Termitomyces sp. Mi166|nr:hypothetical protein C0995_013167 [Termitomyces sp. Mi166\
MASILPTGCQGGILPAPLPQPVTAPAKTTDTSGSDSGNKQQVADGVQIPPPKQPLTDYHPVNTPKSPPSINTEVGSSCCKEPKNGEEKLLPKDKGKKLMKPTMEEVPEEALPLIHPYSGIPEIQISEPTPKNVTTAD